MTDIELLRELGLSMQAAAKLLRVSRQVLHRALTQTPDTSRRGVAKTNTEASKNYFNADRLLTLWRAHVEKGDARGANLIRDVVIERHREVGEMIAPYAEKTGVLEHFKFSEGWVFSREPLEIHYPVFRRGMKTHLQSTERRLVYFVPNNDVADQLLAVLRVASDGNLNEVYIVVTAAVSLCPHWFVIFAPSGVRKDSEEIFVGITPDPPHGTKIWEQMVKVPQSYFRNARDTLMQAGLLDAHDRFKLPSQKISMAGSHPNFTIFYPELEVSR